jgi:hypothetical protein
LRKFLSFERHSTGIRASGGSTIAEPKNFFLALVIATISRLIVTIIAFKLTEVFTITTDLGARGLEIQFLAGKTLLESTR